MIRNLALPSWIGKVFAQKFQLETYRLVRSLDGLQLVQRLASNGALEKRKKGFDLNLILSSVGERNWEMPGKYPGRLSRLIRFWLQHQTVDDPQRQLSNWQNRI